MSEPAMTEQLNFLEKCLHVSYKHRLPHNLDQTFYLVTPKPRETFNMLIPSSSPKLVISGNGQSPWSRTHLNNRKLDAREQYLFVY